MMFVMKRKLRVGIIFGGRSAEHEVSIHSAKNVYDALDRKKYEPVLIGIDKQGIWHVEQDAFLSRGKSQLLPEVASTVRDMAITAIPEKTGGGIIRMGQKAVRAHAIDVIFPVLHGTYGEDGTMQGLLKLANIPFVGPGVLGSAVGMDKDVMKRLFREAGIPSARCMAVRNAELKNLNFKKIKSLLGLPLFIKPANLGSSVGIHKVKREKDFLPAVRDAFRYDTKILIEEFVAGREIECAVLGNEHPVASLPGEVIPRHEFYSYEAKYLDPEGAETEIPARLPARIVRAVQRLAIRTFQTLCLEGMARVDFFLKKNGELLVNEVNTIPGFTTISMYPKMWNASGISNKELIDTLITLAIERFNREKKLKTSFS
jgi:D-alanine-D-alanine ligase